MKLKSLLRKQVLIEKIYSVVLKTKSDIFYQDSENYFRKKLRIIQKELDSILNTCFIRYYMGVYNNVEEAGKSINESDSSSYYLTVCGPVQYAFGSVDSYSYKDLFKYLRERSDISPQEQGRSEITASYIEKILKKNEKDKLANYNAANDTIKDIEY